MNSSALLAMAGLVLGWIALAAAALFAGRLPTFAFLILTVTALFLYVPWVRLRAGGIDGSSRPARFWTNFALLAVSAAACVAFGWMLARRFGLL